MERSTEKRDGQNVIPLRQNGKIKWSICSAGLGDAPTKYLYGDYADRLAAIEDILGDDYDLDELKEMVQAKREERCVVLNMPRKPLVWGDDDQNTCLCPYCGKDLMGIPYGERMVLQCPECGQYLDATKVITRAEAEAALRREQDG